MKPFSAVAPAVVALGLLGVASSAHATSITLNDGFTDNHVEVLLGLTSDTSNPTVSSNCTADGVDQWSCTEGSPIVLAGDIIRSGTTLHDTDINIWDDVVGGTISDTLSFAFTSITPTTAHGTITFDSGLGVTAFPISGSTNLIEGAPLIIPLNGDRDEGTFTLITTPVPEPTTLSLMVLGIAGAVARRRRSRSAS